MATLLTAAMLLANFLLTAEPPPWVRIVAVGCLLLSPVFIVTPFFTLPRYGRPEQGQPYYATTQLVDQGLYSIVRHPQYVGYMLLIIGFAGRNPHPVMVALGVAAVALFAQQAVGEEALCRQRFGEAYEAYGRRVPRFNFLLGLARLALHRSK